MSNVIKVTPRIKTITHKGMHGIVEYVPSKKRWQYKIKFVHTVVMSDTSPSEAEATLKIKELIEKALAGKNKNVRTSD